MTRHLLSLPLWLALVLLPGCQSGAPRSAAAEAAIRSHNQANLALTQGDLERAEAGFRLAMRQATAIDDWAGEGESRIALAVTQQRSGHPSLATATLQPLLSEGSLPYPLKQRHAAVLWHAQWRLAAADWSGLEHALGQARMLCPDDRCSDSSEARLRAQLALQQGDRDQANQWVNTALRQAPSGSELQAQALRVKANIALATDPRAGIAAADAALDIDRRLGNSVGIFQDLLLRTWLTHASGDSGASDWLQRSCTVGTAIGQPALLLQLQQLPQEIWHDYIRKQPAPASAPGAHAAGTAADNVCR